MNLYKTYFHKYNFRRLFSLVFYTLFVVFIFLYINETDFEVLGEIEFDSWLIFLSIFFGVIFRYWGALIWIIMLKDLGANFSKYKQLLYIYGKSWMGRYIPGKITWILGKVQFASEQGIEKEKLALSATLEGGIQILVTLILSLLILSLDVRFNIVHSDAKNLLFFISLLMLILLTPWGFNYLAKIFIRLFKKKKMETTLNATTVLRSGLLYSVGFAISGISYLLFFISVYPLLDYDNYLFVIGLFSLAGVIGILAFFAPNGLGVREGIQLLLMTTIISKEEALVISVLARLWSVVSDLLFFGLTFIIYKLDPVTRQKQSS